jgi:MYXO-CTERM domain-containing protein
VSGGGLGAGGALFVHQGTVRIANSTLAANTAQGGDSPNAQDPASGLGGAVFNLNGDVTLDNATVVYNTTAFTGVGTADRGEGGAIYSLYYAGSGATQANLILRNSIVSDSQLGSPLAHDLYNGSTAGIESAALNADDASWIGKAAKQAGGTALGSAGLSATPTSAPGHPPAYPPQAGSPLIGRGDPATCYAQPVGGVDELGAHRPLACTVGAVEAAPLGDAACQAAPEGRAAPRALWLLLLAGAAALLGRRRRGVPG